MDESRPLSPPSLTVLVVASPDHSCSNTHTHWRS